jgi:hypothetical protein
LIRIAVRLPERQAMTAQAIETSPSAALSTRVQYGGAEAPAEAGVGGCLG